MLIDKYNRIDVNKLPPNVRKELAEIAHDTEGFKDEELNAIYEENFNTLYKAIEEKYPDAIRAKKKMKKGLKVKLLKKKGEKKLVKKDDESNQPPAKFSKGDMVATFFDAKGLESSPVQTEKHNVRRRGEVVKITWQPTRNTYSYNVQGYTGFFLTEENDLKFSDSSDETPKEKKKLVKKTDSSSEGLPKEEKKKLIKKEEKMTCSTALQRIHDEVYERFEQDNEGKKVDWKLFSGKIADYVDQAKKDLEAQHKAAADARANAPKRKASDMLVHKTVSSFHTALKTNHIKKDKEMAGRFAADLVKVYRTHFGDSVADKLHKQLLDAKPKAEEGAQMNTGISFDDFYDTYFPKQNHLQDDAPMGGIMYETYGEEENFIKQQAAESDKYVWTVLDSDVIIPGFHKVNRVGYIITEKPWKTGNEEAKAEKGAMINQAAGKTSGNFGLIGYDLWDIGPLPQAASIIEVKKLANDNIRIITKAYGSSSTLDRSFTEKEIQDMLAGQTVRGKYELYKRKAEKGAQLLTADELMHKYAGKYIDVYPHHQTKWNDKLGRYETVYEVRGVSKKIRENHELPEDAIAKCGAQLNAKAEHGAILNQYAGKKIGEVWDAWNYEQRKHFLLDHLDSEDLSRKESDIKKVAEKNYDELYEVVFSDNKVRPEANYGTLWNALVGHVKEGQYERGGRLPKFAEGEKVNVNDTGYVKYFSGWDLTRPATVLSTVKTKNGWFYKLKMYDDSVPFNNAPEAMLSKAD